MANKGDQKYYEAFISCAEDGCKAAALLHDTLEQFDSTALMGKLEDMHAIEHAADEKQTVVIEELMRTFITPIEREDIAELLHHIDDVVDCLEDALLHVYVNHISTIRPDAVEFSNLLVCCCNATREALTEFPNFRRSKHLMALIGEISKLEEDCDRAFIRAMRNLHDGNQNALEILAWREVYRYLEKCADACDRVAGCMKRTVLKNS